MQGIVDALRQRGAHALRTRDFLHPGLAQSGQPAEVFEQCRTPARADAGDVLEAAGLASFLAFATMAGDRKTMRLIANKLY